MIHKLDGEWAVPSLPSAVNVSVLFSYLKDKETKKVNIKDIAYKPITDSDLDKHRLINADTKYPVILVDDMPNPYNSKYRMVDGRHRIRKLIDLGSTTVVAYILSFKDFRRLLGI